MKVNKNNNKLKQWQGILKSWISEQFNTLNKIVQHYLSLLITTNRSSKYKDQKGKNIFSLQSAEANKTLL